MSLDAGEGKKGSEMMLSGDWSSDGCKLKEKEYKQASVRQEKLANGTRSTADSMHKKRDHGVCYVMGRNGKEGGTNEGRYDGRESFTSATLRLFQATRLTLSGRSIHFIGWLITTRSKNCCSGEYEGAAASTTPSMDTYSICVQH